MMTSTRLFAFTLFRLNLFSIFISTVLALVPRDKASNASLSTGFPYGSQKVRGVNLGGWLVLEPWITPSLFDNTGNAKIIDEYTFGQLQSKSAATQVLTSHWDTYITEDDFIAIAAAGLNHVRIPIGFWAFDVSGGEPYIQGQYPYLKKAIQWAAKHNIWVMIDVHGHPGSQNGYDNSGRHGSILWHTSQSNVARSTKIINTLAVEFSKPQYKNVVMGIEAINEPAGYYDPKVLTVLRQYYKDSYGTVRKQGSLMEVIHDGFQDLTYWNKFMPSSGYTNVMMDTHHYEIFNIPELKMTYQQHIKSVCDYGKATAKWAHTTGNLWAVVGEWTTSPNDCAKYLNGRGVGARYDGTKGSDPAIGDCKPLTGPTSAFSASYKTFLRQFYEAQTSAYELANGWIYWNWKTESTDEWSYQAGIAGGWIPQDPTSRLYPNICG